MKGKPDVQKVERNIKVILLKVLGYSNAFIQKKYGISKAMIHKIKLLRKGDYDFFCQFRDTHYEELLSIYQGLTKVNSDDKIKT